MLDNRQRIIQAAARVYAQHGWRGATTRRIAEEAGVNEVTLFRQFGSKDALLDAAMQECSRVQTLPSLPQVPVNPQRELAEWALLHHAGLGRIRSLLWQLMSEAQERPEALGCASHGISAAAADLREYVVALRRHGWLGTTTDGSEPADPADVKSAVSMLMGALFADAMGRDMTPQLYTQTSEEAVSAYARLFLRALCVRKTPAAPDLTETSSADQQ